MFRAAILLALLASVFGTDDFETEPNSYFAFMQPFSQRPQSITTEGQTVPEGSQSTPCEVGISCWQPLTDKQFSYLSVGPENGTGVIILVPAAGIRLPTAVIVRDVGENLQVPPLPVVVGNIVNLDLNTTAEREVILYYSEDVKDTIVGGNIHKSNEAGPKNGKNVLHIPYLEEMAKGQTFVLLTGHLENTSLEYTFKLSASNSDMIRVVPVEGQYPPRVVDVYGPGRRYCPPDGDICLRQLSLQYKFYLAFENSDCKDYITEKLFINALMYSMLPVVMGAPRSSYCAMAPPNSFIHVDDFSSPADLADYLIWLDRNDTAYASYFAWQEYGKIVVHKEGDPLRPIVSLKGTPTYGLARWLLRRLTFPTADSDTTVCSSRQILENLEGDLAIEAVELLLRIKNNETGNRLGHTKGIQLLKFCLRT
nr:unnamed protein product [Spirometra erinaceieuropaei]